VDGQPKTEPGHEPVLTPEAISSGYFRTMQIPILRGRDFNAEDTADKSNVVIVNAPLAEHFLPGQNPIGKSIRIVYTGSTECTIVGVVPYVRDRMPGEDEIPFQAYQPYAQLAPSRLDLVIRSDLSSSSLFGSVRRAVASIDAGVPIYGASTYKEMIAEQFVTRRLSTLLVASFSGATLFLSAVGLYGVLAHFVGQKTREIGIRMALGAQARNIVRLVVTQGLWPVSVGLTIGILAGLLLSPVHRGTSVRRVSVRSNYDRFDYSRAWDRLAVSMSLTRGAGDPDQPGEGAKRVRLNTPDRRTPAFVAGAVPVTGASCYKWLASTDLT
jgi:hypothetical protein